MKRKQKIFVLIFGALLLASCGKTEQKEAAAVEQAGAAQETKT